MIEITEGMIVWLKTGGPAMTTKFIDDNDLWVCSWFLGNKINEHAFTPNQLTDQDPNPPIMF